jgi:hypothetical protein
MEHGKKENFELAFNQIFDKMSFLKSKTNLTHSFGLKVTCKRK